MQHDARGCQRTCCVRVDVKRSTNVVVTSRKQNLQTNKCARRSSRRRTKGHVRRKVQEETERTKVETTHDWKTKCAWKQAVLERSTQVDQTKVRRMKHAILALSSSAGMHGPCRINWNLYVGMSSVGFDKACSVASRRLVRHCRRLLYIVLAEGRRFRFCATPWINSFCFASGNSGHRTVCTKTTRV